MRRQYSFRYLGVNLSILNDALNCFRIKDSWGYHVTFYSLYYEGYYMIMKYVMDDEKYYKTLRRGFNDESKNKIIGATIILNSISRI
ncbi:MAG TPA: hypothetical protein PLO89_07680 [Spirochaetota bacterium]|nr:hypothetical protein [Spirochaetota bacterium]